MVFHKLTDDGLYPTETIIRLVFSIVQLYLHQALVGLVLLLMDANALVGAGFLRHIDFLRLGREYLIRHFEKGIVEVDHLGKRAVVGA